MKDRTDFLIYGRRFHDVLRSAAASGDGIGNDKHFVKEQPRIGHYACTMYLAGVLSYLEDTYGFEAWKNPSKSYNSFDDYIVNGKNTDTFKAANLSIAKLDAMVCLRNAVIHNGGDLLKNRDKYSLNKVRSVPFVGLNLSKSTVTLVVDQKTDFMEQIRQALIAVSMYHGDG